MEDTDVRGIWGGLQSYEKPTSLLSTSPGLLNLEVSSPGRLHDVIVRSRAYLASQDHEEATETMRPPRMRDFLEVLTDGRSPDM